MEKHKKNIKEKKVKQNNNKNSKIKKQRNKAIYYGKKIDWYYFLPLLIIIGIIPLITYAKVIKIEGAEFLHWKGKKENIDFFSYYKSIWFQVFTYLGLAIYLILLKLKKLPLKKINKYYIPMIIYSAFAIMSAATSLNSTIAMRGFIEQFQGIGVLLAYMITTFLIINFVNNERDVKILLFGFIFSAIIVGLIGIGQYVGIDLFKTMLGKKMILPKVLEPGLLDSLKFTFAKYTIYSTLYNTNFVGSFGAMLFPISLGLFLFAKGIKLRIFSGIFSFITFFTWLGCNSRAGYVGGIAAIIIGIILFRKEIIKNIKPLVVLLIVFLVTTYGMNTISDGRVLGQFSRLNIKEETERIENKSTEKTMFKDIKVDGFKFTVETEKEVFHAVLEGNEIRFYDENNDILEFVNHDGNIRFNDERYENHEVTLVEGKKIVKYKIHDIKLNTYITKDGFKVIASAGRLTEVVHPPYSKIFEGREGFASNRGYIWSRSIPLLKETFVLGYGPDNYPIYFPQDDFIGKINTGYKPTTIVDKPHNLYLQTGINTGVISLVALLALWLIYFIDSMILYIKHDFNTLEDYLGAGITTAVVGYLASCMFNDQIISVAPIFWALLGLGISINLRLKKTKVVEEK